MRTGSCICVVPFVVACAGPAGTEGARATAPAPTPVASAIGSAPTPTSDAAPPAPSRPGLPEVDPALGRAVLKAKFADHDRSKDCAHVFRGFGGVAVADSGHAWLVGDCGLRVRFDGSKLESFAAAPKPMPLFGGSCLAHLQHWGAWAKSEREVYVLSSPRCGSDPNAVWNNRLERFDGRRWSVLPTRFGFAPHDTDLFVLSGAPDGAVWMLAQGDDWHGPPLDAVVRWGNPSGVVREGVAAADRPPKSPDRIFTLERYFAVAPISKHEAWVFGNEREIGKTHPNGQAQPTGASWHYAAKTWSRVPIPLEQTRDASAAADGSLWIVGPELLQWNGASFGRVELGLDARSTPLVSVWARSKHDVWLLAELSEPPLSFALLHWDGQRARRVPLPELSSGDLAGSVARIRGAGEHVWIVLRDSALRVERTAS